MCGRFELAPDSDELWQQLGLMGPSLPPRYNIAPSQSIAVIRRENAGPAEMSTMRWGMPSPWSNDPRGLILARAETLPTKPSFRTAFFHHRCLVPMTGFYEWQGAKRPRQPHHIRLAGQAIFTVAAIAQRGSDTTPSSVALVTTPACQGMASIHDRMPLVVPTDLRDAWLGALEPLAVLDALVAYNRGLQVNTHPVGPYVNSTAHDDARCLAPIALPPKLFPD